jgi:hypothetical protein
MQSSNRHAALLDKADGLVHLKRWGELLGWFAPLDAGFFARVCTVIDACHNGDWCLTRFA